MTTFDTRSAVRAKRQQIIDRIHTLGAAEAELRNKIGAHRHTLTVEERQPTPEEMRWRTRTYRWIKRLSAQRTELQNELALNPIPPHPEGTYAQRKAKDQQIREARYLLRRVLDEAPGTEPLFTDIALYLAAEGAPADV